MITEADSTEHVLALVIGAVVGLLLYMVWFVMTSYLL